MMNFLIRVLPLEEDTLIPAIEVDPNSVTPGVIGFVVTFLVAAGVLLLILDMVRRVRRVRYREEINEKLDREANPEAGS
jgi:capsular polysaccharide biosynthesis protein